MTILEPGHTYVCDSLDGYNPQLVQFVKREGSGYPGNVGHHPGTTMQEVCRVLIDRAKYVNDQILDARNEDALMHLRAVIQAFEIRAVKRHNRKWIDPEGPIELAPVCQRCGHVGCIGLCH